MFQSLEKWNFTPGAAALAAGATRDGVQLILGERFARGLARFDDLVIDPVALSQRLPALVAEPREDNLPRVKAGFRWPEGVSEEEAFKDAIAHPRVACRLYREPNMSYDVRPGGPWADPSGTRTCYEREVMVPEHYADRLDAIRRGRASGTYVTEVDARLALPEEALAVLASLPFFTPFTTIYLMPGNDPRTWWIDKGGPDVASSAFSNRWLTSVHWGRGWYLYEPTIDELRDTLYQWWAERIYGGGHGKYSEFWYPTVRMLEGRDTRDGEREWAADFAHIILGRSGTALRDYCLAFPVRATLMAGALDASLATGVQWFEASLVYDQLLARLQTLVEEVAPLARATLFEWARAENRRAQHSAVCLLVLIGTADDIARLPPIETLEFDGAHLLREDHVDAFRQLTRLKYLHLHRPSQAVFARLNSALPHTKVYDILPSA
jgi:hypothetical protein